MAITLILEEKHVNASIVDLTTRALPHVAVYYLSPSSLQINSLC